MPCSLWRMSTVSKIALCKSIHESNDFSCDHEVDNAKNSTKKKSRVFQQSYKSKLNPFLQEKPKIRFVSNI